MARHRHGAASTDKVCRGGGRLAGRDFFRRGGLALRSRRRDSTSAWGRCRCRRMFLRGRSSQGLGDEDESQIHQRLAMG